MTRVGAIAALAAALAVLAPPAAAATVSLVQDQASALDEFTVEALQSRLIAMRRETGVETFVLVTPSLDGRTARERALAMPIWDRPGDQLVLLVAMRERQVRIESSPHIDVPDSEWTHVIQARMLPRLRAGRQATAIREGLDGIEAVLEGSPAADLAPAGGLSALFQLVVLLAAAGLAGLALERPRRGGVIAARAWS